VWLLALDPTIGSIDTAKNGCELPGSGMTVPLYASGSMRASITTDRKAFSFPPQAVIILRCNNRCNAPRRIDPKGSNRRRMKLNGGSTRSDKSALGKTMASDDKKIETNPASTKEAPSKDKSDSGVDKSEAGGAKIADTSPSGYSRGEGQKPVSKAYKDNWNAIFAKKKKR
jgi:hypothetical protein